MAHQDLWGADVNPNLATLSTLDADKRHTLQRLGAEGDVRLEQERIPWDFAFPRLEI